MYSEKIGVREADQDHRLGTETDDSEALLQQLGVVGEAGLDLIGGGLGDPRRAQEAHRRVDDGGEQGAGGGPQEPSEKAAAFTVDLRVVHTLPPDIFNR